MKWFRRSKAGTEETSTPTQSSRCEHPVSYQVVLREDPSAPTRATGMKCTQCGQVFSTDLPSPGSKSKVA